MYFTLSSAQGGPGCVEVKCDNYFIARGMMVEKYGIKWCAQYEELSQVHPLDQEILDVIGSKAND
jgi:hypothetical protein